MQDFIGQPITMGAWLVTGGKGNTSCEYGMILCRVEAVSPKLKVTRIRVSYPDHKHAVAKVAKVTVQNPNKYVVVNPPPEAAMLFERVVKGTATSDDHEQCGLWLHGQKQEIWK